MPGGCCRLICRPRAPSSAGVSLWRDTGLFETVNHLLVMVDRERVGREASPTAAVLDSQSVKTTESGGPRGYDAGKKVKGRKRQPSLSHCLKQNVTERVRCLT